MGSLRNLAKQAKLLVYENLYSRKVNIKLDHAIFSFTFDDVPVSAMSNGARILERAGVTGTYYVALGMANAKNGEEDFLNIDDIRALHDRGHDIQCHTYSHINLKQVTANEAFADCSRNTSQLATITGKAGIDHFAYPFGAVTMTGKKMLRKKYLTLRTVDPGLNYGMSDMTHLRTVSLCRIDFDRNQVRDAITKALSCNAWVIFVSHDIKEHPSEWGLSPDDFSWAVDECKKTSGMILNVRQAYESITRTT